MSLRRTRFQNKDESYGGLVAGMSEADNLRLSVLAMGYVYSTCRDRKSEDYEREIRHIVSSHYRLTESVVQEKERDDFRAEDDVFIIHRSRDRRGRVHVTCKSSNATALSQLLCMAQLRLFDLEDAGIRAPDPKPWFSRMDRLLRYVGNSRTSVRKPVRVSDLNDYGVQARFQKVREERRFRELIDAL